MRLKVPLWPLTCQLSQYDPRGMNTVRAIVIEDEINVRQGFVKMLGVFCPSVEVVGTAATIEEGLNLIASTAFELLFLDINLPDGSGFDLVHQLPRRNFAIVFVTAYDQYAVDAFKVSAIDYLLKPVTPDLLIQAVEKVSRQLSHTTPTLQHLEILEDRLLQNYEQTAKIILKDAQSLHLIVVEDILFLQADGSYTHFQLRDGRRITTSLNLKEYSGLLQPYGFVRPHHSYLANVHHISQFSKQDGGLLVISNGSQIPVSTRKRAQLLEELKNHFIN